MKRPLIPILLALVLVMQFVQAYILADLPAAQVRLQAQMAIAAKEQEARRIVAEAEAREKFEATRREQAALDTALARIPADVPEPQRTEAAKKLIEIERGN